MNQQHRSQQSDNNTLGPARRRGLPRWARPLAVSAIALGLVAGAASPALAASLHASVNGTPDAQGWKRVTVANNTDHALRLIDIRDGGRLDRHPPIGHTLQPGQSHEWDIDDDNGTQAVRGVYDVLDKNGSAIGGFEAYMVYKEWDGWAHPGSVRNDCSFNDDFSGTCTARSDRITVNEPSSAPTTGGWTWWKEEEVRAGGSEYRLHVTAQQIADFTKVQGRSSFHPDSSDVVTDWFTTAGRTYQTPWKGILFGVPWEYEAVMVTEPTGEGLKLYGPSSQTIGAPTVLEATVRPDARGSVTFAGGDTVLGTAPIDNGVATLTLPSTLDIGDHRIVASYTYGNGNSYQASKTITVNKAAPTTYLSTDRNTTQPMPAGEPLALSVDLPLDATGQVTFLDTSAELGPDRPLGTVAIINGGAQLRTALWGVGTHTIHATYAGDDRYLGGESNRLTIYVVVGDTN